MAAPATGSRLSWIAIAWAAGWLAILAIAYFSISWPYIDVYNNLREVSRRAWPQYVRIAFSPGIEYRPLLMIGIKAAYDVLGLHLWAYQSIVLIQFGAVLALLLWLFRPVGVHRVVAAVVALSCVLGLHTSRILFVFIPLNAYSGALVVLLVALALALHPRTRPFDWIFLPLTVVGLFALESSLLIIPLLVVLWWLEAPGVGLRGMLGSVVALAFYLAVRLGMGTPVSLQDGLTGSGLGFTDATPEMLRNIFEHAPWLFWLYNVSASVLTVVASEPRAGTYRFIQSLLRGGAPFWQWLHVASSLFTTGVALVVLLRYRPSTERDRLLVAAGLVLIVFGSGLGFLYTRDRIALSAGVGYAIITFVALVTLLDRASSTGVKRLAAMMVVGVLAVAWTIRTAETYVQFRDTAWDFHLEWTERYAELGAAQPQTELLTSLRTAALRNTPADPRDDPAWTYALFERRFDPNGDVRRPADDAADNAVVAVSLPFDIRWKPDIDEAMRKGAEAELGLTDAQQVARDPRGRTWEYRLRRPTRERVRLVLLHSAVEDTARIDAQRFEIVQ
jgi:hypothetical protein